jgi:hypothetical protein
MLTGSSSAYSFSVGGIKQIKNLLSISFSNTEQLQSQSIFFPNSSNFHDVVQTNAATLRKLVLPFSYLLEMPNDIFGHLTHLEVWNDGSSKYVNELPRAFHHATQLESLVIRADGCLKILNTIRMGASTLIRLTSFKLLISNKEDSIYYATARQIEANTHCSALADFLRAVPLLQRLDLDLGMYVSFQILFPCIRELACLEVLGVNMPFNFRTNDDFMFLARHLPDTLTDLRLGARMETREILRPSTILPLVSKRTQLLFHSSLIRLCSASAEG